MKHARTPLKIEDTNMALFGSDIEKKVKLAAAQLEPSWQNAGKVPGIEVWRIEKFNVVPWPKTQYGELYDGDSYIVLATKKDDTSGKLSWDVHFWLGKYTTPDEAGTAAYKTVELDDFLGGSPVQYRQVQGSEDDAFLSLFPHPVRILRGGVDSGFRHVEVGGGVGDSAPPQLFHINIRRSPDGKKHKLVVEVELSLASLCEDDTFVLDSGKAEVFVFQGLRCSPGERMEGSSLANTLAAKRTAGKVEVLNSEDDAAHPFWSFIGGKGPIVEVKEPEPPRNAAAAVPELFHVSDASGTLSFEKCADGPAIKDGVKVDANDCYVFSDPALPRVYVWIGAGANQKERGGAMQRAASWLAQSGRSAATPIARVCQDHEDGAFLSAAKFLV